MLNNGTVGHVVDISADVSSKSICCVYEKLSRAPKDMIEEGNTMAAAASTQVNGTASTAIEISDSAA